VTSELLSSLSQLDSRAEELIVAAGSESEEILASYPAEIAAIEKQAEGQLASELEKRSSELAEIRKQELAAIESDREARLADFKKVSAATIARGAELVAESLSSLSDQV
jgi:hypothetical protein